MLGALGGAVMAPKISVTLGIGVEVIVLAFAVVAIGGMGSIEGALIGALIVGLCRAGAVHLMPQLELFVDLRGDGAGARVPPATACSSRPAAEDLTMRTRANLFGALAFLAVGGGRAVAAAVARLARDHRVRQRAGGARPHHPVARPAWCRSARRCSTRSAPTRWRCSAATRRCATCSLMVLVGAVAAGLVAFLIGFLLARYRDIFFAMLSLAHVDDPLRRAGEDRDARLDRRLPRRGRHASSATRPHGADAATSRCSGWCSASRRRRACWSRSISARSPARWRCRCATTRSASSSSASRSTG